MVRGGRRGAGRYDGEMRRKLTICGWLVCLALGCGDDAGDAELNDGGGKSPATEQPREDGGAVDARSGQSAAPEGGSAKDGTGQADGGKDGSAADSGRSAGNVVEAIPRREGSAIEQCWGKACPEGECLGSGTCGERYSTALEPAYEYCPSGNVGKYCLSLCQRKPGESMCDKFTTTYREYLVDCSGGKPVLASCARGCSLETGDFSCM